MKLIVKFNAVLLAASVLGLAATAGVTHRMLEDKARAETLHNARLMLEAAQGMRTYTSERIHKLLQTQMKYTFLPESVPSFAATEAFNALRRTMPEYGYKEAALNPTNPRDRVTDWEADIVSQFRNDPNRGEIVGERETATGRSLYLARPIKIVDANCLTCHTTPEMAPKTMVDAYGPANGFGWKLNETIGAQIVSVPTAMHEKQTRATMLGFMGSIALVFALVFVTLNVMLGVLVIRPVTRLSASAERVSLGEENVPKFQSSTQDEIGGLARAITRMRASLEKAMVMLEGEPVPSAASARVSTSAQHR
ncbi:Tll0287-like domain-containing protein [Caldimonas brevitalea]|uniref:Signal protein n=1 Tax=Caldimonas brevitalea TaxID=413882 RepID=A0A0G3BMR6_9BURK|nr:DUF3365 domain-containing protein [Caldimonas brevitalea]AKJ27805.1 signal protein [Caldimonas brevitalea]